MKSPRAVRYLLMTRRIMVTNGFHQNFPRFIRINKPKWISRPIFSFIRISRYLPSSSLWVVIFGSSFQLLTYSVYDSCTFRNTRIVTTERVIPASSSRRFSQRKSNNMSVFHALFKKYRPSPTGRFELFTTDFRPDRWCLRCVHSKGSCKNDKRRVTWNRVSAFVSSSHTSYHLKIVGTKKKTRLNKSTSATPSKTPSALRRSPFRSVMETDIHLPTGASGRFLTSRGRVTTARKKYF